MEQNFLSPWIEIVTQPKDQDVNEGDELMLIIKADGEPKPLQFQWYHNGNMLQDQTSNILMIYNLNINHSGNYQCCVKNTVLTEWSKETMVVVGSLPTDKVALLIGNQDYRYETKLEASVNDVMALTDKLQSIGFKTFSFVDLTYNSMHRVIQWFITLLSNGAYCFIYYAGHGWENGECYLVPIDAPPGYQSQHCFTVNYILQGISQYQLSLTLLCLDMCRKLNLHQSPEHNHSHTSRQYRNVVISHAAIEHGEAYEVFGENLSVYARYLAKFITSNENVLSMIAHVQSAISNDPNTHGQQTAEVRSTLCEQRKLTDQILPLTDSCISKSTDCFNIWKLNQKEQYGNYLLDFNLGASVSFVTSLPAYNILLMKVNIVRKTIPHNFSVFIFCNSHSNGETVRCPIYGGGELLYINCLNFKNAISSPAVIKVCIRLLAEDKNGKVYCEDFECEKKIPIPQFHIM